MNIDLTSVALSIISGIFAVLSIVIPLMLNKYLTDKQSAATLSTAINNALGAVQQAAQKSVVAADPKVNVTGISPAMAAGVNYVLDHAGPEAARFGITPAAIAEKIDAKIGLQNIQANLAVASNDTPVTPDPMAKRAI